MNENNKIDVLELEEQFIGTAAILSLVGTLGGAITGAMNAKKARQAAEQQAALDRLAAIEMEKQKMALQITNKEKNQKMFVYGGLGLAVLVVIVIIVLKFKK